MWTDGTKFDFSAWGPTEPNNVGGNEHCVHNNSKGTNLFSVLINTDDQKT